jgi:hypothetical protein
MPSIALLASSKRPRLIFNALPSALETDRDEMFLKTRPVLI